MRSCPCTHFPGTSAGPGRRQGPHACPAAQDGVTAAGHVAAGAWPVEGTCGWRGSREPAGCPSGSSACSSWTTHHLGEGERVGGVEETDRRKSVNIRHN